MPNPQKYLKQTLRDYPKPDEEAEKEKNTTLSSIIPINIKEAERGGGERLLSDSAKGMKGYGRQTRDYGSFLMHLSHTDFATKSRVDVPQNLQPSEMVLNLVAREIWSRSRLPRADLGPGGRMQHWDALEGRVRRRDVAH